MRPNAIVASMHRPCQNASARPVANAGWFAQLLYIAAFLNVLLSPGLLSAWQVSTFYILGFQIIVFLFLFLFFLRTRKAGDWLGTYRPTLLSGLGMSAIISGATLYTFRIGPEFIAQSAVNAFALFVYAFVIYTAIILDGKRRFGSSAARYLVQAFFIAATIYCVVQFSMLSFGINNPVGDMQPQIKGEAIFARLLGWKNSRQMMPVSAAFQSGAAIPLAACIGALAGLLSLKVNPSRIAIAVLGVYLLLLLDVQGFLLSIVVAGMVIVYVRSERVFGLIASLAPLAYISVLIIGRNFLPFLLAFADTRGNDAYGLFTGREYIWRQFWTYFITATPSQVVWGNGANGQGISRLSERYAVLFGSFNPEARYLAPLHNAYLQIIVDNGLVGLGCYAALIGFSAYRASQLSRQPGPNALAWRSIAMLIFAFAFIGASEVSFTLYLREGIVVTTFAFILVALCGGDVSQTHDAMRRMREAAGRHRLKKPFPRQGAAARR